VSHHHRGQGEPEAGADLTEARAVEIFIDLMFKNPNHKPNEDEETNACNPEVPSQWLQEHPCVLVLLVFERHNHFYPGFSVGQCKFHIMGPVHCNRNICNGSIIILFKNIQNYL